MQFPGIARKCSDSLEIGLQFRDSKGTRQSYSVRSLFTSALSYHAIPTTGRWQNKWNQKLSTWQDSNQGAEGSEAKPLATWPIGQILMKQKDRLFRGMNGDEVEVRNRSTFPNKNHAILKSVFRNVCSWIFVKHYALVELQERARQSRWPGWPQANFRSPRHAWAIDSNVYIEPRTIPNCVLCVPVGRSCWFIFVGSEGLPYSLPNRRGRGATLREAIPFRQSIH